MPRRTTPPGSFFVAFDHAADALREIDGFVRKRGKVIVALTVREILGEALARKLA
jgi:hypothetical protein